MPFGSHPPITAPMPIPAETGLGPVAGYSGFKAFDWKATQSFPTALTSGPLRFCISCRLLNARHLGFETNVWKIKDLVQTVDQEVGGSNPPSCTGHRPSRAKPVQWSLASRCGTRCLAT